MYSLFVLERFIGLMCWDASSGECYGMRSWESIKNTGERTRWSAHSGTHTTEHVWNAACVARGCIVSFRMLVIVIKRFRVELEYVFALRPEMYQSADVMH